MRFRFSRALMLMRLAMRGSSPRVLAKKVCRSMWRLARRRLRKYATRRQPGEMADGCLARALAVPIEELGARFRARREPAFPLDVARRRALLAAAERAAPGALSAAIREADATCRHRFDILGSGPVDLGASIDWQRDFKSGYSWDAGRYFGDIPKMGMQDQADIRVPWELSRFQFLPALGKAYWYAVERAGAGCGDDLPRLDAGPAERYAREFVSLIDDWIERNPAGFGVNWVCTMDVAIRAVNWIWGMSFFRDSPLIDERFIRRLLKSLLEHGRHINRNLEYSVFVSNNHYLSNLVGLLYLGIMFPEFREARAWRRFARGELVAEMGNQVFGDGTSFEASTSYHCLAAELFASAYGLCSLNGIPLPPAYGERLERMFEFILHYTKPDGTAPQIGDGDDGRLHRLSSIDAARDAADDPPGARRFIDHRYLLAIGGALFDRDDLSGAAGTQREDAVWLLGRDPYAGVAEPRVRGAAGASVGSRAFPAGGYYIMRSDDLYMVVDCMPHVLSAPVVHRHCARLSFEVAAFGRTFLVDPGSYVYTGSAAWRNRFRGTAYHNTVMVDAVEMDEVPETMLFRVIVHSKVRVRAWESTEEFDLLDAEHNGYERLAEPVTHRRRIFFHKRLRFWIVADTLTGTGRHAFQQFFHFAPSRLRDLPEALELVPFDAIRAADRFGLLPRDVPPDIGRASLAAIIGGTALAVVPLGTAGLAREIGSAWVSYSYGTKREAPAATFSLEAACPVELVTVLYPFEASP